MSVLGARPLASLPTGRADPSTPLLSRLLEHPAVLREARSRAFVTIWGLQLRHVIGGYGVTVQAGVDAVETRGAEAEDLRLHRRRQRLVPEALHQRFRHREAAQGLDLPLRRAPPDGIGSPQ